MSPEIRLSEKRARQAALQEAARPVAERIGDHGKVRVWSIAAEKYLDLWPIDAREQFESGAVLLDKPDEAEDEQDVIADSEEDSGEAEDEPVLNMELTIPDLREIADDRGIDIAGLHRKDDIYSAIELAISQADEDSE